VRLRSKLLLQVGLALFFSLGFEISTVIFLQRRTLEAIMSETDLPWAARAFARLELAELLYASLNAGLIFVFWMWLLERTLLRPLEKLETTIDPGAQSLADLEESARVQKQTVEGQREQLDLTEAQLTRAEQMALLGRLGAGLAHEIGNPLGAVMGYLSLVKDETRDDVRRDMILRSEAELQRMDGLIRELLDYARPQPIKRVPVPVDAWIDGAKGLLSHQPRGRHVTVSVHAPAHVAVLGDPQRLTQVLLNLLLNAADAMDGRGVITVRVKQEDTRIIVDVEDEGPGFSREALAHAAEPFFTTKGPGHGTGLGLAVSQTLVRELGGQLTFGNAEGTGARVRLNLASTA
jgi:two-component system, NtrC family, sensor kinase